MEPNNCNRVKSIAEKPAYLSNEKPRLQRGRKRGSCRSVMEAPGSGAAEQTLPPAYPERLSNIDHRRPKKNPPA